MKTDRIWILLLAIGLLLVALLWSGNDVQVGQALEGSPGVESTPPAPPREADLGVAGQRGPAAITSDIAAGFSYQGMLTGAGGAPVNGVCNILFRLYNAATGGTKIGGDSYAQQVKVTNGLFAAQANAHNDFGDTAFQGQPRYLQVAVKCNADTAYTYLSPRQEINPTPYALGLRPGVSMQGNADVSLLVDNLSTTAPVAMGISSVARYSGDGIGVDGGNLSTDTNGHGAGVKGSTALPQGYGVYGVNSSNSEDGIGVHGLSEAGLGVYGQSTNNNPGIGTKGLAYFGVWGETVHGWALYGLATGSLGDGVYLETYPGRYLIAGHRSDTDDRTFSVTGAGEVYADGTYHTPAADVAEMLPAVDGLEAGDVLVIGEDGRLQRCTRARQTSLVGVYSTKPAVLGGVSAQATQPRAAGEDTTKMDSYSGMNQSGQVPLAVVGIAPVKVSAENGAIRPGDLLTTSPTPGHAMKAGADMEIGTILGKALGSLARGTGVIKVLIMLQ